VADLVGYRRVVRSVGDEASALLIAGYPDGRSTSVN